MNTGTGIRDLVGNALSSGRAQHQFRGRYPVARGIHQPGCQPHQLARRAVDYHFQRTGHRLLRSSLSLTNSGGANLLTSAQTLTTTNNQAFVLGNLTALTTGGGNFTLTLNPAGITDVVGNVLASGAH